MWITEQSTARELEGRKGSTGDHVGPAFRVLCVPFGRVWPIPFGTMGDAERAAKLFNELCTVTPGMSLAETRAMVFAAMGGSYESVRRYVVERVCRW